MVYMGGGGYKWILSLLSGTLYALEITMTLMVVILLPKASPQADLDQ